MDYLKVSLTHLNIRQSIIILLSKLVSLDLIAAVITVGFYLFLIVGIEILGFTYTSQIIFFVLFSTIGAFKIILNCYVVLQWLNEYYEITTDHVIHKRGIIFRKTEQYRIDHIRRIDVQDTLLGELFNFATISLYDIRLNKFLDMVLIHNPARYAKVLKELNPALETEHEQTIFPFLSEAKEDSEREN